MNPTVRLSQIIGCWELVRFEITDQDGGISSWGDNSAGLLIYTEDGHVSVSINSKSIFTTDDSQKILDGLMLLAARGDFGVAQLCWRRVYG